MQLWIFRSSMPNLSSLPYVRDQFEERQAIGGSPSKELLPNMNLSRTIYITEYLQTAESRDKIRPAIGY
ncbi:hypothetical protein BPOR_0011g00170 [Botrytis porri]|uniref:Uncharacterized protein n=1 Tax=Botrytis porri TaxID=87229 RepID=A0A4Z1L5W3_9HELO|nr:hypothetical protein BPOR_0011g00170 [Botrytis porri]